MSRLENRQHRLQTTRRRFLQASVTSAAALAFGCSSLAADPPVTPALAAAMGSTTTLSEHLMVYHGSINVGIVRDGDRALLIDCGDEGVFAALQQLGIARVDQLLLTHYHRDQSNGAQRILETARIGVPAQEKDYFTDPATYWNDDSQLYRVYQSFRPDHLMPVEPMPVERGVAEGDRFSFGPAAIQVIDTPGHTDGSISFVVEVDGRRVIFSGDCIAHEGKIWDVFSLQRGFQRGGQQIGGYHGFMGDRWRLAESLEKIKQRKPDLLVPSHGAIMPEPAGAIETLIDKLETCYENYVSISALRHYFPRLFTEYEGKPGQMPMRPGIKPPDCLRHFGTTWLLVSKSGGALVMDVGSRDIVDRLKQMQADGEIKNVEGLWVTHYHFDHTDGIVAFQQEFDCPCLTDRALADVLTRPLAWRLPCLAPETIRVDQPLPDGHSWQWHEFTMTSYFYPGQTLYHSGLLVEVDDLRMFFVGDSHTMGGIDDYCAHNRNSLGRGVGFQYCLSLIERLKPSHMFNCHVNDAFTFTPGELQFMRTQLDEREPLFGSLVAWDHANFGLDPSWVRPDPYRQTAGPGTAVNVEIVITNHSADPATCACRAAMPQSLGGRTTAWSRREITPKSEQGLSLTVSIPAGTPSGRYVIPLDVKYRTRELPRFSEAIIDVVT